MDYKGIDYLRKKLNSKRPRVLLRHRYYDEKNNIKDYSRMMPKGFEWMAESVGWCAKSVDSLADRLVFRGFKNDIMDIGNIFKMNNSDILIDSAIHSALISACSFAYISKGADGFPRLQIIDGANATGVIDPITRMLNEGYAVLERDEHDAPVLEAYFQKGVTTYIKKGKIIGQETNKAPYCLLVPFVFRPSDRRAFGHSRISRACMDITDNVLRTLKRSEVSSEFYSFPQKYITGLSNETEPLDSQRATISSFLAFTKDMDGDKPTLGQFTQQSMAPYVEYMRMMASLFAGETGLTLDDLGFSTDNPASAEAIKSAHENLRLTGRKAQRTFNSSILNIGLLSACVRDDFSYNREAVLDTIPKWYPIFEPDAASLSGLGDAFIKIGNVLPEAITIDVFEDLTGLDISSGEIELEA